ncbi:UDP-2,3-diacylglucosamine diphosphatase [Paludibacter sp. 221]|uniref:UDP-2,3-diacylglucosamine diphosphatase n=1 Tax=Paludibacter sp. 221 TaxID=2302939 RepID=UPI0013D5E728|nr:UDP-2,3-diacylglucosamine diphosphatase [Paludibacter sp. 221]NDV46540.1 UDP-2,3-diacylglucosamine diphosphatase [Paludibacter sp. 221]
MDENTYNQPNDVLKSPLRGDSEGRVYFISDAHLGSRIVENPRAHEKKIVDWLDMVKADAKAIYMVGDMFDFWYEYKTVVPKGYVRFLGKLAELVDSGIEIRFFTGNHDIWTFGYLENEVGLIVHRKPQVFEIGNKKLFVAHGDGLAVDDKGFKFIRNIFHNRTCQKLFRFVPPQIGQGFGYTWSRKNREKLTPEKKEYKGEAKEPLIIYAKKYFAECPDIDFVVFGHRHIQLDLQLANQKRVIILGDFVSLFTYGVFDGNNFWLENFI